MRVITEHQINECNSAIEIEADEPNPKNGNASHDYLMHWKNERLPPAPGSDVGRESILLRFQNGPIAEVGTNGITHEALLAILADRLRGFQSGAYACQENADALSAIQLAQECLHSRTRKRVERGVEGTNTI